MVFEGVNHADEISRRYLGKGPTRLLVVLAALACTAFLLALLLKSGAEILGVVRPVVNAATTEQMHWMDVAWILGSVVVTGTLGSWGWLQWKTTRRIVDEMSDLDSLHTEAITGLSERVSYLEALQTRVARLEKLQERVDYIESKSGSELSDLLAARRILSDSEAFERAQKVRALLREAAEGAELFSEISGQDSRDDEERAAFLMKLQRFVQEALAPSIVREFQTLEAQRVGRNESRSVNADVRSHFRVIARFLTQLADRLQPADVTDTAVLQGSFDSYWRRR